MVPIFIYITTPDEAVAENIARTLLERRLVGCVNIFPPHQALYVWDGVLQKETETALICKSHDEKYTDIEQTVREIHPYDTPCIVSWSIDRGHQPFLSWLEAQTESGERQSS